MKILIIDDEVPIRKYITKMVQDCGVEYEVVASVGSGQKALDVLAQQRVDLIFADITMPKMTGLELLEVVKHEYPDTDVFMLTCHSDFEFARTAMKLQADNYILKDEVNPGVLQQILKAAKEKREKAVTKTLHRLQSDAYFIQLMEDEDTLVFDSFDLEKHKIFLKDKEFIVLSVANSKENLEAIATFRYPILENQEVFSYQETNIILIGNLLIKKGDKIHEEVRKMILALQEQITGPIGESPVYYKINLLKKAVLEAGEAYNYKFYHKSGQFQMQDGYMDQKKDRKMEIHNFVREAHGLISEKKYNRLFSLLSEMVIYATDQNVNIYFLKKKLQDILGDYQMKAQVEVKISRVQEATNIEQIQNVIRELREAKNVSSEYSEVISEAVAYMEQHFEETLNLPDVAEFVHLNPDYFSRRFKKETGSKFSDYLQKLRMEEARKLLLMTELSVTEIAGRIGFNNDGYFSTTFKKVYGENPNEVRKNRNKI